MDDIMRDHDASSINAASPIIPSDVDYNAILQSLQCLCAIAPTAAAELDSAATLSIDTQSNLAVALLFLGFAKQLIYASPPVIDDRVEDKRLQHLINTSYEHCIRLHRELGRSMQDYCAFSSYIKSVDHKDPTAIVAAILRRLVGQRITENTLKASQSIL